jgi:TP901 family phage tail tape measure protein
MPFAATHKIIIDMEADTADLEKDLHAAQKQLGEVNFAAQMVNSTVAGAKYYGIAAAAGFAAMVLPTVYAARAVGDFDENLHRIVAIGSTDYRENLRQITDSIVEFSMRYGSSTDEISAAAIEFVKTGYRSEEMLAALDPTMKLAIANQVDAASTAELMNNAWVLFGKQGGMSFTKMADEIQAAANASKMDVLDLFEAFQYSGSAAAVANIPFEQYLAMVGALSQIAAGAGESIGTLMTRIYTNSEKLESLLGNSGIVDEAKDNTIDLTQLFQSLGQTTTETRQELFELWGVRNAKNFAQLYNATDEYNDILGVVNSSTGTLDRTSAEMATSINALWERTKAALLAPISDQGTLNMLNAAIGMLFDTLSRPEVAVAIQYVVRASADFLYNYGPQLGLTIQNLGDMVINLVPILDNLATSFTGVLQFASALPPELLTILAAMVISQKIMPGFIGLMGNVATALGAGTLQAIGFRVAAAGILGGFALIIMSKDPLVKALGVITVAVSALATAFMFLSMFSGGLTAAPGFAGLSAGMKAFQIAKAPALSWGTKAALYGTTAAAIGGSALLATQTNGLTGDVDELTSLSGYGNSRYDPNRYGDNITVYKNETYNLIKQQDDAEKLVSDPYGGDI